MLYFQVQANKMLLTKKLAMTTMKISQKLEHMIEVTIPT